MSLKAYQSATQRSEPPRQTEYRLFGDVTRALIEAAEAPGDDVQTRIAALDWNRRLWGALASDCAVEANRLPDQLRAHIISLSLWVNRHSSAIMRGQEGFQDLIDVNRMIMQGLEPRSEAA